jgi:hypothetical protein
MSIWKQYVEQTQAGTGTGEILFTNKPGTYRLKIVASSEEDTTWFQQFTQEYEWQGKKQTSIKYAVRAIHIKGKGEYSPVVAILPKSAMAQVFRLLLQYEENSDEGFNLLSEGEGHPISVTNEQNKGKTEYTVQPSAKAFNHTPLWSTDEGMEWLELEDVIAKLNSPKDKGATKAKENKELFDEEW